MLSPYSKDSKKSAQRVKGKGATRCLRPKLRDGCMHPSFEKRVDRRSPDLQVQLSGRVLRCSKHAQPSFHQRFPLNVSKNDLDNFFENGTHFNAPPGGSVRGESRLNATYFWIVRYI